MYPRLFCGHAKFLPLRWGIILVTKGGQQQMKPSWVSLPCIMIPCPLHLGNPVFPEGSKA